MSKEKRKVLCKRWIPAEWPEGTNSANCGSRSPKPGTGCYSKRFDREGEFMGWGIANEERSNGIGGYEAAHYSVALVQFPGQGVEEMPPSTVQFQDQNKTELAIAKLVGIFIITVVVVFAWEFGKALLQNINR